MLEDFNPTMLVKNFKSCEICHGSGKIMQEVAPLDIEDFFGRPERLEFQCICGKKEIILKPMPRQLPHGWMQWGTDMICTDCIYKMLHAAMTAAMQKISQIKES
jgi:hypothetical protein